MKSKNENLAQILGVKTGLLQMVTGAMEVVEAEWVVAAAAAAAAASASVLVVVEWRSPPEDMVEARRSGLEPVPPMVSDGEDPVDGSIFSVLSCVLWFV